VTVTDASGCTGASVPVSVSVNNPTPVITASDTTTFCAGGNVDLDAGSGFSSYLWSNGATSQTITVDSSGNYSVTVTDAAGCTGVSPSTTSITVNAAPDVIVSPDDTINLGLSDTLTASGAVSYQWQPGNGSGPTFIVSPTEETTYTVIGTDSNGCVDTALVRIYVDAKCVYWLPNVFSPNGDAQNDELKIYGRGLEWTYLTVYDRWGNRVFESSDLNAAWDGKYQGNVLNTGVYVYILKGKCIGTWEEFEKHGNVTLTR
jgi:gliding motility-associated-like protein